MVETAAPPVMLKVRKLVLMTRPHSFLLGVALIGLASYLSDIPGQFAYTSIICASLAVVCVIGFSFVINDYKDAQLDAISKPARPIPAGHVSPQEARNFALALAAAALLFSLPLGLGLFAFTLLTLILSAAYSYRFKGVVLLGNFTIAFLNASVIVYGSLVAGQPTRAVYLLSLAVFLYTLASEVLYAVQDREGDLRGGVHTTATILGERKALWLFFGICMALIALVLVPWLMQIAPPYYIAVGVVGVILPLLWVLYRVLPNPDPRVIKEARRVMIIIRYAAPIIAVLLK
jgi:geranylgeranylglycerol-phosphate geranylgeranyltransferase